MYNGMYNYIHNPLLLDIGPIILWLCFQMYIGTKNNREQLPFLFDYRQQNDCKPFNLLMYYLGLLAFYFNICTDAEMVDDFERNGFPLKFYLENILGSVYQDEDSLDIEKCQSFITLLKSQITEIQTNYTG
jgi:hypothetical protein